MKGRDLTRVWAVTLDQRDSRHARDAVPGLMRDLERVLGRRFLLPPERTAGDEVQVLLADPAAVVDVVEVATRLKVWRLGIGLGDVEGPLPDSTRAARGGAYLAARTALEEARHSPTGLRLMVHESVGRAVYGEDRPSCAGPARRAETALWLWQELLGRRTDEGWEIVDLLDEGRTVGQAADHLGITASAASQRHRRAGWEQSRRGRELCVELIVQLWEAGGHA